jgi:PPOX class probable F420-dependent enzyme
LRRSLLLSKNEVAMSPRPFDPAREPYVSLATFRRNGREVCTPVWIAAAGDEYFVFSTGDAGKVKRIRATGRVRMAACDVRGKVKSEWIEGHGRIVAEPNEVAVALSALGRKYGWKMAIGNFFAKLTGRYAKRAYLGIRLM